MQRIIATLDRTWGEAACELEHQSALELLVACILVVQTTPRKVNQVTRELFARFADARALSRAPAGAIEAIIQPTGFSRYKAARIRELAGALIARHGGEVPRTLGQLERLPGVSRRSANAVLGDFYGLSPGFIVDANVLRVARRLGLCQADDALAAERELMALLPRERWIDMANELMWHGRRVCRRAPACHECTLAPECPSARIDPRPYPWGDG